jgi:hypothetical protein
MKSSLTLEDYKKQKLLKLPKLPLMLLLKLLRLQLMPQKPQNRQILMQSLQPLPLDLKFLLPQLIQLHQ